MEGESEVHSARTLTLPLTLFVFLGAMLLFSMEPMVGRLFVPAFGGAAHVWATILMWFQGTLFLAYLYAHLSGRALRFLHPLVLVLPALSLPFLRPASEAFSLVSILQSLSTGFLLPFFALATTSVVAQRWLTERAPKLDPYPLYAASNTGSLLALLVYALVIEPYVGLTLSSHVWAVVYGVYALLGLVLWFPSIRQNTTREEGVITERPSKRRMCAWVATAGAPSAYSISVTNDLVAEVGNHPLLWIAPLSLYLLAFILPFSRVGTPRFVKRFWMLFGVGGVLLTQGAPSWWSIAVLLLSLLVVIWAAHGELFESRPPPQQLTLFYLSLALGGWLGSAAVALGAPYVLNRIVEHPISLFCVVVSVLWSRSLTKQTSFSHELLRSHPRPIMVLTALIVTWLVVSPFYNDRHAYASARSPYGSYRVLEEHDDPYLWRKLHNGQTSHGVQDVLRPSTPLAYYHQGGPLGDAMRTLAPKRLGVVGLGVGTINAYEQPKHVTFYEIDPLVVSLAKEHFTYLGLYDRDVTIKVGDGRKLLEEEVARNEQPYDVVIIDAFSGDSVPTHLLTVEAVDLYLERAPIVVLHISNRYFDLVGVVGAIAERSQLAIRVARTDVQRDLAKECFISEYVVLSKDPALLDVLSPEVWTKTHHTRIPFTDDLASAMRVLR